MTREIKVILKKDTEDESAKAIINAIQIIKGVESVHIGPVLNVTDYTNRQVAKTELKKQILELLK